MNLLTRGCFGGNLSSVLCVPKIITFSILGLFFVLASVGDGSPGPGYITGDVTVFQKKLFGKLLIILEKNYYLKVLKYL